MAESIRSGSVLAVWGGLKRPKYGVSPLPFVDGMNSRTWKAFIIDLESNIMQLSYPSRASRDTPARIFACAQEARSSLIVQAHPNGTLVGALNLMETYSFCQSNNPETERDRSLNVALGGPPTFRQYGRFVPCKVLAQRNPFPDGSYASRPCSCDIESAADNPKAVKDAIRRRW